MSGVERPARVAAAALGGVLLAATLDDGGSGAHATLAVHVALAILVAAAWLGLSEGRGRIPAAVGAAFAGLAAVAAAGALAAPYGYAALLTLLELGAFAAAAWLAARAGPQLLPAIRPVLLAAAAVHGSYAVLQAWRGVFRPPSTFFNPNHAGAWLGAVLLLAAFSFPRSRAGRLAVAAASIPAVAGFFLTGSRGALIGVAVGIAAGLIARGRGAGGSRVRWVLAGGGLAGALAAAFFLLPLVRGHDPFAFQRVRIWRASVAAVLEHPWTGTGPGQFAVAAANLNFPLDEGFLRYPRAFATPHSDLLRAPCELGWPGFAALVALAAAAAWRWRKTAAGVSVDAGAAAALGSLLAQAVVEDLSVRPAVHLLFAVLAGAVLAEPSAPRRERFGLPRLAAAAGLLLAVGVAEVGPYRAWRLGSAPPRDRLERALRWNPFQPRLWLRRSEDLAASPPFDLPAYARAREAAERAVRLQPADAAYRRGLARLEAKACLSLFRDEHTRARAAATYAAAESLARHDPFIPIEAAAFLLSAGDRDGARRAAERALRIEPNAIPPRILLAAIALEAGGAEGPGTARRLLDDARRIEAAAAGSARESAYTRSLLIIDPAQIGPVERRLAAATPQSGERTVVADAPSAAGNVRTRTVEGSVTP